MRKATPGPWRVDAESRNIVNYRGRHLAGVFPRNRVANARLLASAPDMLKALMAAHHRMSNIGCNYDRDDDFRAVCDAIAKAEGRERAPNEQAVEARAHHPRGA